MFCENCEFEIKGEGRKKCPVCGGPLVEYSEFETSPGESKSDSEVEGLIETTEESNESDFFDLESALNADDEVPSSPAQKPEPVFTKRSREDILANPPKKPDPIEEFVSTATKKSERKQKRSSKLLPVIVVVGILIIVVQAGVIFFLKSQQKLNPLIAQLKKGTEQKEDKILSAVVGKEKETTVIEKEHGFVDDVQTAQEETLQKKTDSVSEENPVAVEKDVQTPQVKAPPEKTVKKEENPAKPIEKKASSPNIYSIHAGSYKTEKVAIGESNRLKRLGLNAYVQVTDPQKGEIWYRVKIGDFSTRKDAQKVQDELSQKDPKLKPIIVKRKAETKKPLVKKEERKSIAIKKFLPVSVSKPVKEEVPQQESDAVETTPPDKKIIVTGEEQRLAEMELAPDDTQPEREEVSQQKPDFVEPTPPLEEVVTTSDEQPLAETEFVPDHAKPEQVETSRLESDSVAMAPPAKGMIATGNEQPLVETGLTPDSTKSDQERIAQQKPDAVKTVADGVPEKDDALITVSVPPQSTIEKVEEVVTPDGMITSEREVGYSINANSYQVEKIAVDEVIRLKLLGLDDVYIRTDDLGEGEIWYRVMIGKFSTRGDAEKVQDELRQKDAKLKSIIIKLENESIE